MLHIVGDDGEEVPAGESGTIYFEGGATFEYHNDAEKTKSSRHPRGWSTLGDVGYVDDDGFLYLTDRKAYMIISGGVNIYPQEAENVLVTHPKVVDVAVFGVPNDDFGEEVKAVVQPVEMPADAEEADALAKELIAFCRSQLADVKCPRSIDFRAELPRHPTGKLYKRHLKDEYWAAAGRASDLDGPSTCVGRRSGQVSGVTSRRVSGPMACPARVGEAPERHRPRRRRSGRSGCVTARTGRGRSPGRRRPSPSAGSPSAAQRQSVPS